MRTLCEKVSRVLLILVLLVGTGTGDPTVPSSSLERLRRLRRCPGTETRTLEAAHSGVLRKDLLEGEGSLLTIDGRLWEKETTPSILLFDGIVGRLARCTRP